MRISRVYLLLGFTLGLLAACAPAARGPDLPPTPPVRPPNVPLLEGSLKNQVTRLEKSLPRAQTEGFVVPSAEELAAFAAIPGLLNPDHIDDALAAASSHEYELFWYTDKADEGAASYLLREADPSSRGWGLYVFRTVTSSDIIVEAPHPISDADTPSVAVDVFRALGARALLIAGAHRDANRNGSADAAHEPATVFQSIHTAELQRSIDSRGSGVVLQIHGFGSSSHPGYPDVIVSYEHGKGISPADILQGESLQSAILKALEKQHVEAGTCSGGQWRDLCGATNIQASTAAKGIFIHIELDDNIRQQDRRVLAALESVFSH